MRIFKSKWINDGTCNLTHLFGIIALVLLGKKYNSIENIYITNVVTQNLQK